MKEGRLVASGAHGELIEKEGYYYELIQKQLHDKNWSFHKYILYKIIPVDEQFQSPP